MSNSVIDNDAVAEALAAEPSAADSAYSTDPRPALPRSAHAAAIVLLGMVVAVWPIAQVIIPGPWVVTVVVTTLASVVTGMVLRRLLRRRSEVATTLIVMAVQVYIAGVITFRRLFPADIVFGAWPGAGVWRRFPALIGDAMRQVTEGVAPLDPATGLIFALTAGCAGLVILLDALVGAVRLVVPAIIIVLATAAIPSLAVSQWPGVLWLIAMGLYVVIALRMPQSSDSPARAAWGGSEPAPTPRPGAAVALLLGTAAIVASLILTPFVPLHQLSVLGGAGAMHINTSLDMGSDLRQHEPAVALTLMTTASRAPYLRVATLSRFDGDVWHPDTPSAAPLRAQAEGRAGAVPEGVEELHDTTSIRITALQGDRIPVPSGAVAARGLDGAWRAHPENDTVTSSSADAADQVYTIDTVIGQPTLEQLRQSRAFLVQSAKYRYLPEDLPPELYEAAASVTVEENTDYERLVALQDWFRSSFHYSLTAPVDDDFDGTGVEALSAFLEARAGYCVHFAGAFAVMARTLDMPSRIVVGYLPGAATTQKQDDKTVYAVSTDQLHAWPEVFFEGIGWVAFEPTATLGIPATTAVDDDDNLVTDPEPTPTADTDASEHELQPTLEPEAQPEPTRAPATDTDSTATTMPWLWVSGIVLVVLLLPAGVRRVLRSIRMHRASHPATAAGTSPEAAAAATSAAAAEWQATLTDYGFAVPHHESVRASAQRLVATHGMPEDSAQAFIETFERATFARPGQYTVTLAPVLHRAIAEIPPLAPRRTRVGALIMPRSVIRAVFATVGALVPSLTTLLRRALSRASGRTTHTPRTGGDTKHPDN
ncbi:transglutaminaseTgpA domain-containing protein [Microbacterium sp. YY-01]|uniref:transglutaminaseTgpA domain-containing protein n=1 Tax=Microbacterium sp. YY-01 TaxID=3421634 RepID=UPI003D166257